MLKQEIQDRLDALPEAMSEKGLVKPRAQIEIEAGVGVTVWLFW